VQVIYTQDSPKLDMLRSIAVMLVLIDHFVGAIAQDVLFRSVWGQSITGLGLLGVEMFFIHTSLVLMMSLNRLEQAGEGSIIGRFYVRRIFRIYPLSILTVLVVVALHIPMLFWLSYTPPSAADLWSNLLLVMNITNAPLTTGQLWSLPYEVQMYLLLPFIYFLGKRIRQPLVLIGLGLAVKYVDFLIAGHFNFTRLLAYAPWFFMGVAAYFSSRSERLSARLYAVALTVFIAADFIANRFLAFQQVGWVERALGIGFCLLLPHFQEITSTVLRRTAHLIAKYSYGIYLSHVSIMWFAFRYLKALPFAVQFAIFSVLMIVIPLVLYHAVEEPFIRLGSRLAKSMVKKPVAAAAAA
jgi:peptidoglycan/LPS O-acetylase OafA/YrhL